MNEDEAKLRAQVNDLRALSKRLKTKLNRAMALPAKVELTASIERETWARFLFAQGFEGIVERWLPHGTMTDQLEFLAKLAPQAVDIINGELEREKGDTDGHST